MLAARIVGDKSTAASRPLMAHAASADSGANAAFEATKEKLRVMIEARRKLYAQSDVHLSLLGPEDDEAMTSGRIPAGITPEAAAERFLRAIADRLQEAIERRASEEITNAERFSVAVCASICLCTRATSSQPCCPHFAFADFTFNCTDPLFQMERRRRAESQKGGRETRANGGSGSAGIGFGSLRR